ncbi:MAG: GMC family oxidoreductase [Kineosporiaceae bacterium]
MADERDDVDYDVVVIGSGFGGSVAALRLTEKGYRVGVLEAGRRFADHEHARTSWRVRDYLWAPALGCHGVLRMTLLSDIFVLSGAGVGGGSLNYANTLYRPPEAFYRDRQWAHLTDWRAELAPHYDQAARMLGVADNPVTTPADRVMQQVAAELGVADTYRRTPVGVLFADLPDAGDDLAAHEAAGGREVADPYFGGAGPTRRTCRHCGECMTGCRHGAKNTTVKNYLHLAEAAGARVHPMTTVRGVRPRDPDDPDAGYEVTTLASDAPLRERLSGLAGRPGGRRERVITARQVIFAASALGTQRLLHRLRDEGHLPRLSPRLGELTRSNSEALTGARAVHASRRDREQDYSRGVAITSSIHPDEVTHIEPVRHGHGSNLLALITSGLVDPADGRQVRLPEIAAMLRRPRELVRVVLPRRWSEQIVVLLSMQSLDNSLTTYTRPRRFAALWARLLPGAPRRRLVTRQGVGEPNPTWIPVAHTATRAAARILDGVPGGSITTLINRPMTAHFIGGCPIGATPTEGVVDGYQRLYGHPGLHVADGSAISANLGVNPALTITAQAERAMSLWPNRGEPDPRPALGEPYRRLDPVAPRRPAVPAHAPAALRVPRFEGRQQP